MHALAPLHTAIGDADFVLAKATGVREVARIARIETRLRSFLWQEWRRLSERASEDAMRVFRGSGDTVSDAEIGRMLRAIDKSMNRWAPRVTDRFVDDIEDVYKLAREAAWRKGTKRASGSLQYNAPPFSATKPAISERVRKQIPEIGIDFDLKDRQAIRAMRRNNTFWIGQHYDRNVQENIRDNVRGHILEQGRHRRTAGAAMQAVVDSSLAHVMLPSGWTGTTRSYFESLVANAATVARVQGQLRSFDKLGITTYTIVNPMDERTCPVCGHLDGKVFSVSDGIDHVERVVAADTPDDVRKVHPWIGFTRMSEITKTPGSKSATEGTKGLYSAGFSQPPFHFRCRCTVDVEIG